MALEGAFAIFMKRVNVELCLVKVMPNVCTTGAAMQCIGVDEGMETTTSSTKKQKQQIMMLFFVCTRLFVCCYVERESEAQI